MSDYTHPKDEEFFSAIGRLTISWAHVEFAMDALVQILFHNLGNPSQEAEIPVALKRRTKFIRKSLKQIGLDDATQKEWDRILDQIVSQSEMRHDIIHGAIVEHESGSGMARFYRVTERGRPVGGSENTFTSLEILDAAVAANRLASPIMSLVGRLIEAMQPPTE